MLDGHRQMHTLQRQVPDIFVVFNEQRQVSQNFLIFLIIMSAQFIVRKVTVFQVNVVTQDFCQLQEMQRFEVVVLKFERNEIHRAGSKVLQKRFKDMEVRPKIYGNDR
jgi:hypothetical protein